MKKWTTLIAITCLPLFALAQDQINPVPALLRNLDANNPRVAASAARSLGVVFAPGGRDGEEVTKVTQALIGKLGSTSGTVKREAATALGAMLARDALDPLKETIRDADYTVAVAAANAVRKILPVEEARTYLKEIAGDPTETVQIAAYDAMVEIAGANEADVMIKGLAATNWRIQTSSVRGLERSINAGARPGPEVFDQVAALLGNEVANVAEAALHLLSRVRHPDAMRAIIAATDAEGEAAWRTRMYAVRTIYNMGWPRMEPGLSAVVRQLGDPTQNVVNEARGIINWLRSEHKMHQNQLFPILLQELEVAQTDRLRAGLMAEMGHRIPSQYATRVATVASAALKEGMTNKEVWAVRAHAINLLAYTEHTTSIEDIAQCVGDDVPNVRQNAGGALGRLWSHCTDEQKAKIAPILQPYLSNTEDWRKTSVAARNAGYYPSSEAILPLVKLLTHGVVNVKDSAAHSLQNMCQHKDDAFRSEVENHLIPQLEATDLSWEYGVRVLGALQNPAHVALLTRILERGNWRAQENGAKAAAAIADGNKVEDKALNDVLIRNAQSTIVQVQEASNDALRALAR